MLCRLYQWQMELQLDDGQKIAGRRLQKHLNRCSACRQYAHRFTALSQTLTAHPPVLLSEQACRALAAGAAEYVERGLFSDRFSQERMQSIRNVKRFAGAMAAGLLVGVGLLMFNAKDNIEFKYDFSPINLGSRVIESTLPEVAEWSLKPMQTEIEKLATSAQDAAVFLWNCMPGHFEPTIEPSEPNTVLNQDP